MIVTLKGNIEYIKRLNKVSRFWRIEKRRKNDIALYKITSKDSHGAIFKGEVNSRYLESKVLLKVIGWK